MRTTAAAFALFVVGAAATASCEGASCSAELDTPVSLLQTQTIHSSLAVLDAQKTEIEAWMKVVAGSSKNAKTAQLTSAAAQLANEGKACLDDAEWRDADGDGCAIYKHAIDKEMNTREGICFGGPRVSNDPSVGKFCRSTCATCSSLLQVETTREAELAQWKKVAYTASKNAKLTQEQASSAVAAAQLENDGTACVDNAEWRDADGDGCAVYQHAIEEKMGTQQAICHSHPHVFNDPKASVFCRSTCGMCSSV